MSFKSLINIICTVGNTDVFPVVLQNREFVSYENNHIHLAMNFFYEKSKVNSDWTTSLWFFHSPNGQLAV